jgi:quercetin dioxygenase-like cupin family protein
MTAIVHSPASQITIVPNSTVSKTVYQSEFLKTVLFAFDAGQELSEHTASSPAVLHILSGKATVVLEGRSEQVESGDYIVMPAGLPHSIHDQTENDNDARTSEENNVIANSSK